MKTILKLIVVGLLANAGFHTSMAWLSYYRFKDAVTQTSQFGDRRSIDEIHDKVMEHASEFSLPVQPDGFTVRRDDAHEHTYIDGSYTQSIDLLPGYRYPWTFTFHVDTFVLRR
jgi:hypothetical protein